MFKSKRNKEYLKLMKEYNEHEKLGLKPNEIEDYAQMFNVINQLTNDKLNFKSIYITYYISNDVLTDKMPASILSPDNKFKGIYVILKEFPSTENLNEEELKYLAFSMWYASCVEIYDEKKQDVTWAVGDFESADKIKKLYEEYLKFDKDMFTIADEELTSNENDYGFDIDNPIELVSIGSIYTYLNSICLEDGSKIEYERTGSFDNKKKVIIDEYVITSKGKETRKLYFSGYGVNNSKITPKGFKFK